MPAERDIIKILFTNFINSLKPRRFTGNLIGKDYNGTEYYETPLSSASAKSRPARYFTPKDKDDFEQELPAEWEAWLRFRRKHPPTEEEVLKNKAIAEMKKKNAMELEAGREKNNVGELVAQKQGMESFPKYEEYEETPGRKKF